MTSLRPIVALVATASLGSLVPMLSAQTPAAPDTVHLSRFEVTADQDRGYASTNAVGGTRFDTALVNLPQSVVVINQEFMKDLGAHSVIDAAQYVSGVSTTAGANREVFNVRGYQVDVTTDGMPDGSPTGQGLSTPFELLDRVEIIKGPSAVLYGSTSPGGNVNRITKKPFFRNETSVEVQAGEGGYLHGTIDANRTTKVGSGDVAVRLIAAHEQFDDVYVNFSDSDSYFISPSMRWRITPRTTVTVIPYYLDRNYHKIFATMFQFLPYNQTGALSFNLPREADWGGAYAREKFKVRRLFTQLEQQMNDHWSVRLTAIAKNHDEYNNDIIPRDLLPDNRTMQRTWRIIRTEGDYRDVALDSLVSFDLGATKNKTLFVAQYDRTEIAASTETGRKLSGQNTAAGENSNATFSNLPLIDVFNPSATALEARPDTTYISASTFSKGEITAISVQHQIELFDGRLVGNAGVRYDSTKSVASNRLTQLVTSRGKNTHYTKRAGAVYKPLTDLGLFVNYSETFAPVFRVNPDGTGFDPTEGDTLEAGVKTDLISGRISGTVSWFTIDNRNLLVIDPDPLRASAGYSTQSAKDSLDGVEFDLHFNLLEGLQVITSYSKIRSKTNNGLRVRNVPDDTAALFASYKIGAGKFGWTLGGGIRYKGENPGDAGNVFYLNSATVVDAFVKYRHDKHLTVALNANNVFDRYYADSSINHNLITIGAPRRVTATVDYAF